MSKLVNIKIDGREMTVPEGMPVIAAAGKAGIRIPTLCALKGVSNIGSCRVCVVEVEGQDAMVSACNTPVADGASYITNSERVIVARKMALQLILQNHGLDTTNFCFSCVKNGACELQALCREYDVKDALVRVPSTPKPIRDDHPFLRFDPNLCIGCQRCVGACHNKAHAHVLNTAKKGTKTVIKAPFGSNWAKSDCESCGNCAQACPTGALVEKRRLNYTEWGTERVTTTCPHCAVGCQLTMVVKDGKIVDVEAADGPSNKEMLCVKGRSASYDFVTSPERLTTPLIKNHETGEFEPADWDVALDLVAKRLGEIKDAEGGNALAAFACSRSTNEDIYLLQKMARTAFDTNNVDNCARV